MSFDNLVLLYASISLVMTPCLIVLNNIREDAERAMNEPIDFNSYIRRKEQGDVVDKLIAEHITINKIAA